MFTTASIICTVISIAVAFFVVYRPLFVKEPVPYFTEKLQNRFYTESIGILEMIKDLETDFKTGKISQQDYNDMTLEYKRRYLEIKEKEEAA